jgi:hypothetical protein
MDSELVLEKLRRQFPELEEGVVKEALMIGDYNFDRASKILQVRYDLWGIFGKSRLGLIMR